MQHYWGADLFLVPFSGGPSGTEDGPDESVLLKPFWVKLGASVEGSYLPSIQYEPGYGWRLMISSWRDNSDGDGNGLVLWWSIQQKICVWLLHGRWNHDNEWLCGDGVTWWWFVTWCVLWQWHGELMTFWWCGGRWRSELLPWQELMMACQLHLMPQRTLPLTGVVAFSLPEGGTMVLE